MNLPKLPPQAQTGFVIPGLNKTLISVTKLCAAGCNILFNKDKCIVTHKGKVVLEGIHHHRNGLWYVPSLSDKPHTANYIIQCNDTTKFAGGVHQSTSMEETIKIKFLQQCLFCQPVTPYARPSTMANSSVFPTSLLC